MAAMLACPHRVSAAPDSAALIVVDMQNASCGSGAARGSRTPARTIDVHLELLGWFREKRRPIVFTRFIAGPSRTLMWNWSPQIRATGVLLLAGFPACVR
jgi:nicotinamidase-related amidase